MTGLSAAARVRESLDHPIIDADGHFVELGPILQDEVVATVEELGGPALRERFLATARTFDTSSSLADRDDPAVRAGWKAMPSWWGWQTANVRDRATAHLPALLHERLDEMGIDHTILYPSMALGYFEITDGEVAAAACMAVNRLHARQFAPYTDRCTVGALVPMTTPDIAVTVLRDAVEHLGFRTAVIAGYARRELPDGGYRLDMFGLDSEYDYDPFWGACVELGIAPVVHSALQQHRVTRSVSNYVYNHVNGLAAAHESLCKSLFLSGVTYRFPQLRVGFLEGGVAWACALYASLAGHYDKRNREAIRELDPDALDVDELAGWLSRYGDDAVQARLGELREYFARPAARPANVDEFAAVGMARAEDLATRFVPNFSFGCEADDPLVAWAFREDVNPFGARLRPIFGSDISHWDVRDMNEPVAEAFELVEHGVLTREEFREFTFVNPARLHVEANPDFFAGTTVERAVREALAPPEQQQEQT